MGGVPVSVTRELTLRLLHGVGPPLVVHAQLRYGAEDPYAVDALFDAGGDAPVRWVFSRDLLAAGLRDHVGEGDVSVGPVPAPRDGGGQEPAVRLRLASPDGSAVLEASALELAGFLGETYAAVPAGAESAHLDVDAAIGEILERH